ncbi:MAG: hypothetical protein GTN89_04600 [Acidobacteria bacterium]|nr:hypothetical protein [Acidobacteriota bacterium]NIM60425.1 hypothetical protein [Acidobacteriota bacterium]NIO58600.1 hypothetical protein [Acidobacteriota bacterium]NIQ29652.1 hypothetical protein [Acidobacteriota bacterium]NIQ84369.1 hypothetical protein [Acidobacteriota bacterium]
MADFEAWQAVFDEHAPSRARAGYLGHYIKRGIDDPDRVFVYSLGNDADALRAYLEGDELEATLRNAGVEDEPTHIVMRPMSRNLVSGRMLPGIIVVHDVEDYDRWRIEYDAFEDFRRRSGIIGHAVSRSLDAPDRVVVYHQANEVGDLRAFVESDELRDAMHEAGVVGELDIHYIRVVGFADY